MHGMNYPQDTKYPQRERPDEPVVTSPMPTQPVNASIGGQSRVETEMAGAGMAGDDMPDANVMGDDYGGTGGGMVSQMAAGLARLAPEEMQLLDAAITPEIGLILTKALGPEFGQLIAPLMQAGAQAGPEQSAISNFTADRF